MIMSLKCASVGVRLRIALKSESNSFAVFNVAISNITIPNDQISHSFVKFPLFFNSGDMYAHVPPICFT